MQSVFSKLVDSKMDEKRAAKDDDAEVEDAVTAAQEPTGEAESEAEDAVSESPLTAGAKDDATVKDEDGDEAEAESEPDEAASSAAEESSEPDPNPVSNPDISAYIQFAGKQHKVAVGDELDVCIEPGETEILVTNVLAARSDQGVVVGSPTIEGAEVVLNYWFDILGPKTINFKRRRRKHSSKRTIGHRQNIHIYTVASIDVPGLGKSEFTGQGNSALEDLAQSQQS